MFREDVVMVDLKAVVHSMPISVQASGVATQCSPGLLTLTWTIRAKNEKWRIIDRKHSHLESPSVQSHEKSYCQQRLQALFAKVLRRITDSSPIATD